MTSRTTRYVKDIVLKFIFCSDPLNGKQVDPSFASEAEIVEALGGEVFLVDYDTLVHSKDFQYALREIKPCITQQLTIYRGWMLKPWQYNEFYNILLQRGIELINSPNSYRHCHWLPESYPLIKEKTPRTVWMKINNSINMNEIMALLKVFGNSPLILKDFVKSSKHYWNEACYIPSASDRESVERVVKQFLELQGDDLNEGLVFREFVELKQIGIHSKSRFPLTQEFRVFVLDGYPISLTPYWGEGIYDKIEAPLEEFSEIINSIKSRFFTIDLAFTAENTWTIIELGDAQVAGLPEKVDIKRFYQMLMIS